MNEIGCDLNEWPIVRMHFPNNPTDQMVGVWLKKIDNILLRAQPCIVISTFAPHYQFSVAARRKQALWFKRNKELLSSYCIGMVRVTEDLEMIAKITSNSMRQGMPFICIPVSTIKEADSMAKQLLYHSG